MQTADIWGMNWYHCLQMAIKSVDLLLILYLESNKEENNWRKKIWGENLDTT